MGSWHVHDESLGMSMGETSGVVVSCLLFTVSSWPSQHVLQCTSPRLNLNRRLSPASYFETPTCPSFIVSVEDVIWVYVVYTVNRLQCGIGRIGGTGERVGGSYGRAACIRFVASASASAGGGELSGEVARRDCGVSG